MSKKLYWYHLCQGTTTALIDSVTRPSWQAARAEYKRRGYTGSYILHQEDPKTGAFKVINITL